MLPILDLFVSKRGLFSIFREISLSIDFMHEHEQHELSVKKRALFHGKKLERGLSFRKTVKRGLFFRKNTKKRALLKKRIEIRLFFMSIQPEQYWFRERWVQFHRIS